MNYADSVRHLAQVAYEAYVKDCNQVSVKGEPLPIWPNVSEKIKQHWYAAIYAVMLAAEGILNGPQ